MNEIIQRLRQEFNGKVDTTQEALHAASHDASIYELLPHAVVRPQNATEIGQLVRFASKHKAMYPTLSLTPRSGGTDMSGGPLSSSLVLDMTAYFTKIHEPHTNLLRVQPGVFLRDIDPYIAQRGYRIGSAPASRAICTIGGMVGNNSGGEQSLRFGNTDRSVRELRAVLADGKEYTFKKLTKRQLDTKLRQDDFEGGLYRRIFQLITDNYDAIRNGRPQVNKNSMGYNLWSVWNPETETFDLTQLLTGSQGTLGIITDITLELQPTAKHSGLLIAYLDHIRHLGDLIKITSRHQPASFEGFDDVTFNLGIKYFSGFKKQLGTKEWAKQQAALIASVAQLKGHIPNIILMIEFEADGEAEVAQKIARLRKEFVARRIKTEVEGDEEISAPFWQIRRASLSLLRNKIKNKYASPFIDDLTVQPRYLPKFLPELRKIIRKHDLPATIAGHFGDGNFHIIPLLDIATNADQEKLEPIMRDVVPLVLKYHGTLAGEHNDGMIRGPWLPAVFGDEISQLFRRTKEIFDPLYIFNPHKKTDASWEFSMHHIRSSTGDTLIK